MNAVNDHHVLFVYLVELASWLKFNDVAFFVYMDCMRARSGGGAQCPSIRSKVRSDGEKKLVYGVLPSLSDSTSAGMPPFLPVLPRGRGCPVYARHDKPLHCQVQWDNI